MQAGANPDSTSHGSSLFRATLSALLCMTLIAGCTETAKPPAPKKSDKGKAVAQKGVLGQVAEFRLTDQNAKDFTRKDLDGKVWIATFIFTRCTLTCPIQSRWMARLQKRLRTEPTAEDIRLVSFTVDPEYDTAEVLKKYAGSLTDDDKRWHFLTGAKDQIASLAKDSFHLPSGPSIDNSSEVAHDARVVLVDRQGRIRGYYDIISDDSLEPVLKGISQVLPEFVPPAELWTHTDTTLVTHLAQPPEILNTNTWLQTLSEQQQKALADSPAFHDFQLQDKTPDTGITFRNQILDEQRSRLQVNHFDHGNGLCAADVDSDGLLDLYFVNQAGPNALYRNLGGGKFEDITEKAGVGVGRVCVSAAFADVNNDQRPDLFVTTVRGGNMLFLNQGEGRFADVTKDWNVGYNGHSSSAVFFDYNHDGYLDLFVANVGRYTTDEVVTVRSDRTNHLPTDGVKYYAGIKDAFAGHLKPELTERSILYRNDAGKAFVDVTEESGLIDEGWAGGAIPIDANEDGWMDLYVLNMQGHDHYYENQQGQKFVDRSEAVFPKTPWGAMGGRSFDFNQDGHFDLMVTDMHSDMSETVDPFHEKAKANMQWPETFVKSSGRSIYGNAFYMNQGNGQFSEVSDQNGSENFWPWGMSTGDVNADGFEDVLISSGMCFPYRYSIDSLLLNENGQRFRDSEFVIGLEPKRGSIIVPWFELDCEADKEHPMCRDRSGKVVVWSARGSRSSLIADLDEDGDQDVVISEFNTPPQILFSNLSEKRPAMKYVAVRLKGTQSNPEGFGATVTVTAGGRDWHQQCDGISGYLSQSSIPLYFGLGETASVDRITVKWPSGKVQTMDGPINTNQLMTIIEQ